ncbi:hypothetical protein [Saccharopolyspora mangrovi]|uniref:Uncharacterized protein n=1 Tax=Saccharopolyspora mangrovi TaxID=3082379 RepID=A0ABU6AEU9_9PSEU|nr:hypothetical protein [Saccharopolyspora sp. S2-29]MEB3370071.1 hypothetical protein [Saccharopolyspora sp. S2-29]
MEPDQALSNGRDAVLGYRAARVEYFETCEAEHTLFVPSAALDYLREQIVDHAVEAIEEATLLDE